MKFKLIFTCFSFITYFTIATKTNAQVTIGSFEPPLTGSLLTLTEGVETTKGLMLPRVVLTDINSLDDIDPSNTTRPSPTDHIGLVVYNVGDDPTCPTVDPGLFAWQGDKWQRIGNILTSRSVIWEQDQEGKKFMAGRFGDAGVWMLQNISVTKFADGTPIQVYDGTAQHTEAAYTYPNATEGSWGVSPETYNHNQGLLYNWKAATKGESADESSPVVQGICPNGWHIPCDREWSILGKEIYTQPSLYSIYTEAEIPFNPTWSISWETSIDTDGRSYRGSSDNTKGHGSAMKSQCPLSQAVNTITGGTSLRAKAGGLDVPFAGFVENSYVENYGYFGYYWTSTSYNDERAWFRYLYFNCSSVGRNDSSRSNLFSVRCKKD